MATITVSDQLFKLLPADPDEAALLVNEILEQALLLRDESFDQRLENRPDWQAQLEQSRQDRLEGRIVSHEEVLRWHQNHPLSWSETAFHRYQQLPAQIRDALITKFRLLSRNPQMYQVETFGQWKGLRRIVVGRYKVYYTYWHANDTIYIEIIT